MEIWAHTVVKNEARWLWYSVSSIITHVDKLLLWDTGSTDESIKIEKELVRTHPGKIILKQRLQKTAGDFTNVRQEMLDETKSDWFLMLDGDEVWWNESIKKIINTITDNAGLESIVVPTVNLVGDIFHYQDKSAGKYHLAGRVGHYNLRGINRNIPGLKSLGSHGTWGWADSGNKMIQDRNPEKIKFADAPYLHASFLPRGNNVRDDRMVVKRSKKLKYEIGKSFPKDFYYPESLFRDHPDYIPSPWQAMNLGFKFKASLATPLKKIRRKIWDGKAGY